jgi:DNA-binding transcriptional LysR family regulator
MTQPAFSRRIRALEAWLGVELFDRSSQPARLTATGEWFRGRGAETLLARVPRACRRGPSRGRYPIGHPSTGGHPCAVVHLPARLAARAGIAHPHWARCNSMSDVLARCEALLAQGQVHFMLCHTHAAVPGAPDTALYPSVVVGTDILTPVCAPKQVARKGQPFALHTLEAHPRSVTTPVPVLGYSAQSGVGRILQAVHGVALRKMGVHTVFTAALASVLKTMAMDGRGIAWLPASLVAEELAQGQLVPAGSTNWTVPLEVRLYRDPAPLSVAAEGLWATASRPAK